MCSSHFGLTFCAESVWPNVWYWNILSDRN